MVTQTARFMRYDRARRAGRAAGSVRLRDARGAAEADEQLGGDR